MTSIKHILLIAAVSLMGLENGLGQTTSENYIKTYKPIIPLTGDVSAINDKTKVTEAVGYFDGLGRSTQTVLRQNTALGYDLVSFQLYDEYGRKAKVHLPYPTTEITGASKPSMTTDQSAFYQSQFNEGSNAFSLAKFEASELNRVLKQGAPGASWQPGDPDPYYMNDNTVKKRYTYNIAGEVTLYQYNETTGLVTTSSSFAANALAASQTFDEKNNVVIVYTDKEGRAVCKKAQYAGTQAAPLFAATYYVYDTNGRLMVVLPPQASIIANFTQADLDNWAFQYRYDGRGRMTQKKVPGADWVYMVYDNRDRLILTQDGNQRSGTTKYWTFTKYDLLNRPIMTGIKDTTVSLTQAQMQTMINSYFTKTSARWGESMGGTIHGYTNRAYPVLTDPNKYLTVTYYDDYAAKALLVNPTQYDYKNTELTGEQPSTAYSNVKTLVTVTKVRVLDDTGTTWLSAVNYYDDKGRVIQQVSDNIKGGKDWTTNIYDFPGKVLKTKTTHSPLSTASQVVVRRMNYDHAGRQLQSFLKLNDQPEVLIAAKEYNELGQLITNMLHAQADELTGKQNTTYSPTTIVATQYNGERALIATTSVTLSPGFNVPAGKTFTARTEKTWSSSAPVVANKNFGQVINYRYNIRGWLTRVNNSDLTADAVGDPKDFFGMNLVYEQNDPDLSNTTQFNGNISGVKWNNFLGDGTVKQKGYAYTYDALNRILASAYTQKTTGWAAPANNAFVETNFGYDLNGNITALRRNDLRASGWMDDLVYTYVSGNKLGKVTDNGDDYKGFIDGANTGDDYTYDQNGNMITDQNKGITTAITYNHLNLPQLIAKAGNTIKYAYDATGRKISQVTTFGSEQKLTDYAGQFQYENNVLQWVAHEEGRIMLAGTKLIASDHGESTSTGTAVSATLSQVTQNGEKYLKAVASASGSNYGVFPLGGTITVQAGEVYKIRMKGYRDKGTAASSSAASLTVKGNGTAIGLGAQLPQDIINEAWVEKTVVIPAGATQLTVGAVWTSVLSGEALYINELEVSKLEVRSPEYQYVLKDHLGNERVTFTTRGERDEALATLEVSAEASDRSNFLRYDMAKRVNSIIFDHTNGAATGYSVRLNGTTNERIGLARSLSVMPGDTIRAEVYAKYVDTNSGNWTAALNTLLSQVASGAVGVVIDGGGYTTSGATQLPVTPVSHTGETGPAPKAYINYVFINRDFDPLSIRPLATRMTEVAKESGNDVAHELLTLTDVVKEPGYVYIYLSNDNLALGGAQIEVYFDDFKVTQTKSPVIQTDDYYPFGLAFNSYQLENSVFNRNIFNGGSELTADLNVNWYQATNRVYAPDLGRFWGLDVMSDLYSSVSPMIFGYNNPIKFNDPLGLAPTVPDCTECNQTATVLEEIVVTASRLPQQDLSWLNSTIDDLNPINRAIGIKYKNEGAKAAAHYWLDNRRIHFKRQVDKSRWAKDFDLVFGNAATYGVGGMMLVTAGSPLLMEMTFNGGFESLTFKGALTRMGIDASIQTIGNILSLGNDGLKQLDLTDVVLAGSGLNLLGSASLGSTVDWQPFSNGDSFSVVGFNKPAESAFIDLGTSVTVGGTTNLMNSANTSKLIIGMFNSSVTAAGGAIKAQTTSKQD